jgi:hypothetical protein
MLNKGEYIMNIKEILNIPPSPYKAKLARYGVTVKQLAKYLHQNYAYTCHQLNGTYSIPESTKVMIEKLLSEFETIT